MRYLRGTAYLWTPFWDDCGGDTFCHTCRGCGFTSGLWVAQLKVRNVFTANLSSSVFSLVKSFVEFDVLL